MSTLTKLIELYAAEGLSVRTGLHPLHFPNGNPAELPFSYIFRGGEQLVRGGGPSIDELAMFETLFEVHSPKSIFVVGNAYGWSTLALSLMNPNAQVVAIDLCPRPEEYDGLEMTNRIAAKAGMKIEAIKARSPEQVADVAGRHLNAPIDFTFIDGGHTVEQQAADFQAIREVAAPEAVYVFHDVVNFGLTSGFAEIARSAPGMIGRIMLRTSSGMAILYPESRHREIGAAVEAFCEDDGRVHDMLRG